MEQNPGGQLISVSGEHSGESVASMILLDNKQLFISIIKCKTANIDRRHSLSSYDRSTTSQSSAFA
jgi:hypothetical protein